MERIDVESKKASIEGVCYYRGFYRSDLVFYKSIRCDFDSINKVKVLLKKELDSAVSVHKTYK